MDGLPLRLTAFEWRVLSTLMLHKDIVVDEKNKIVTTPAMMVGPSTSDIAVGIENGIAFFCLVGVDETLVCDIIFHVAVPVLVIGHDFGYYGDLRF